MWVSQTVVTKRSEVGTLMQQMPMAAARYVHIKDVAEPSCKKVTQRREYEDDKKGKKGSAKAKRMVAPSLSSTLATVKYFMAKQKQDSDPQDRVFSIFRQQPPKPKASEVAILIDGKDSSTSRRNLGHDFEGVSDSSGASDVEIESEDADKTNVKYPDQDEDKEAKGDSQNDGRFAEDVNHVCTNEDPSKYATFESDAENDDGDDDDQAVEIVDDTDMNLPVPPDTRFDRTLLAAIRGWENITRGSVPDAS
ncbi:Fanconi anemia group J [Phytophthora cinnamomi]|uniref:Fanconi anemia group J n=1 Tax=Phytophthora cinnamomi TaxID=4785 RepID=UPI003559989B|nr:Fanconi anemia group J [Phytophthora cinnamomi]